MSNRPHALRRIRWSWMATGIPLLLLSAGVAVAELPGLTEGPMIHLDERWFQFGEIPQHTKNTHQFRIRNDGSAPLRITKVDSDCGCAVGVIQDSLLAPGEETALDVTFESGTYDGEVQKVIALYTNDPAEPRVDLVLKAVVKPPISVEETTLDFGSVQRGRTPIATTRLTVEPGSTFEVTGVKGGEERVNWTYSRESSGDEKKGETWLVTAKLRPDAPVGTFYDRCEVLVAHPKARLVRVFVRGSIYSYFRLAEEKISFDPVKAGRTLTRTVRIEAEGNRPYEIVGATSSAPFLKPELRREGAGYILTVTLNAPAKAISYREQILLATTDPEQPQLRVDVRGIVVDS